MTKVLFMLILILGGIILKRVAEKKKIPSVLLLIMIGILLKEFVEIDFHEPIFFEVGTLTLVLLAFDAISRFRILHFDSYHEHALKSGLVHLIINILFLSIIISYILPIRSIVFSLVCTVVLSSVDPAHVFSLFRMRLTKFRETLMLESYLINPIIIFLVFTLIDFFEYEPVSYRMVGYLLPLAQKILIGFGIGIFAGLIFFGIMKKYYSRSISMVGLIVVALFCYVVTELGNGNGIFAVLALGFLFANIKVKHKKDLQKHEATLIEALEVLVSIFFGYILSMSMTTLFVFKSIIIYMILLSLRFFTVQIVHLNERLSRRDTIHMTLNCPKGYATIVIAFALAFYKISYHGSEFLLIDFPVVHDILNLVILITIYSLFVSWAVSFVSEKKLKL